MAKTIGQLTALAATPDASDELVINDGGVTKKITVSNLTAATLGLPGTKTVADQVNLAFDTTTGTKLGTADDQKIGFWDATPVVQPAAVADATDGTDVITQLNDLLAKLRTIGLIAT